MLISFISPYKSIFRENKNLPNWVEKTGNIPLKWKYKGKLFIWENGNWFNDGIWENGIWIFGNFFKGIWKNGIWKGGVFDKAIWMNGTWEGGIWNKGVWNGGNILSKKFDKHIYSKYNPKIFYHIEYKCNNLEELIKVVT